MIVDGNALAEALKQETKKEVAELEKAPHLFVLMQTEHLAVRKFVDLKERVAREVGVEIVVHRANLTFSTEELVRLVREAPQHADGIIVQLPLAPHVTTQAVLDAVPAMHDVDVLSQDAYRAFQSGRSSVIPPVVGAIKAIVERYSVSLSGRHVVVVGAGKLVGKPAAVWFEGRGAQVHVVVKDSPNFREQVRAADILVLGAGVPGLIEPDMVRGGVAIFDAGTSDSPASEGRRKLAGDANPACAQKASLFTPVPGGIGPVTVAMIFKNLVELARYKKAY